MFITVCSFSFPLRRLLSHADNSAMWGHRAPDDKISNIDARACHLDIEIWNGGVSVCAVRLMPLHLYVKKRDMFNERNG